jgi:putative membrane protein
VIVVKPFRVNILLQGFVIWLLALWIVTAIHPLYPRDWLLENLLVFTYSILLVVTYRFFVFSNLSYGLFTLFLSLHLIGAHYTYAETPVGFWLQDWFGFERNHYDRLVHFSFGLLIAYPFQEFILRRSGAKRSWSYLLAICGILSFSAVYEMLEMIAAMLVSPELGAAYLGTQGDEWDAQKDSLLAFLGALAAMTISCLAWRYGGAKKSG